MIILLTGASHTGKTLMAQRLMEKHHIPYFSLDHLKMGLIRSGNTRLTPESSEDELTECMWPIVKEMIKTAIENTQNLIIEGCYIPYDWTKDFEEEYLHQIKYVCLVMSEKYIQEHFTDIRLHACAIEDRQDNSGLCIEGVLKSNHEVLDQCQRYNLPYFLIDDTYPDIINL